MFNYFKRRGKRFTILAGVLGALVLASSAFAIWAVYTASIDPTSAGGASTQTGSPIGALLIVPGTATPSFVGSPTSPQTSIELKVSNRDPGAAHTFKSSPDAGLTLGTPTTSSNVACPFATLSATPLLAIQSAINAALSGKILAAGDSGTNYEATAGFNVSATAPAACAGVTVTFPLTGTLAS